MNALQTCLLLSAILLLPLTKTNAQVSDPRPAKVSHAEPLYYDLVRDLGARKGEREINIGADFRNISNYNGYGLLAEYEFAPVDRLGLEAEADLSFFRKTDGSTEVPHNRLEGIRLSAQYSFFVSPEYQATMAAGYTQVFELADFRDYGKRTVLTGTVYNPFFVAAKRWGENFHTLLYTSSLIEHNFSGHAVITWQINTAFHYTIPQTKHFIGIELNKEIDEGNFELTIRPQVKVKLDQNFALGFVTGFPVNRYREHFSTFFRIIYEP